MSIKEKTRAGIGSTTVPLVLALFVVCIVSAIAVASLLLYALVTQPRAMQAPEASVSANASTTPDAANTVEHVSARQTAEKAEIAELANTATPPAATASPSTPSTHLFPHTRYGTIALSTPVHPPFDEQLAPEQELVQWAIASRAELPTTDLQRARLLQLGAGYDPVAQWYYSEALRLGKHPFEQSEYQAFQWLKSSANKEYPEAQFRLGLRYLEGKSISRDADKAFSWIERAAQNGHKWAQITRDEMKAQM